ncbi:uncharacterized protein F5147DRAFT_748281 [Suillus discolor]|uniref:DUF6830 domain-containing protein n=1 Tax=Suillus discolor TaxID=1912936 RepID=A0A9P7EUI8_9AGAM|nr:uncharacterized protein F5147DRAFT_748281 [Suillus discolor]KAG2090007.1 hypothetical protein F5147DRAFT_748281 [Suillus discolor]
MGCKRHYKYQPLTSYLQRINKLQSASQILLESGQHMTTSTATTRTPSPVHHDDFLMDFEVEGQDHSNVYYEGIVPVNLENDLPGSIEESWGDQVSEKPYVEHFEGAAKVYQCGQTFQDRFNMDPYSHYRKDNLYYPFASLQDWELGKFLLCSSLSMAAIDQFLGLELIKSLPLSFFTAKELHGRAELLPSVPKWQYCIISTTHPTKQPVCLYWHDPLDCIKSLFSHLHFSNEIDFTPTRVYNMMEPWSMQSQLPEGATLLGVILSSDKTNITNMTGGRVAHPLLISLANIKMATRNKASSHAFLLTALLPIAEFLHPVKWLQSVLEARLVHQCLDVILEPLKQAACIRRMMSDPLASIECDPQDVEAYFTACAPFHLSGVAHPPCFLTPEALHHWHPVGAQELDFHFFDVTGRAQRDLQHYIVALIADAAPPGIVIAVRALMDFWYLSQATILNTLQEFHDHKQDIIACGAHLGAKSKNVLDNWHIPKLDIRQVGSLLQWSANTTEHAHITLIKDPADSTNNNNIDAQICRFQTTTSLIAQLSQSSSSLVMDNGSGSDDKDADVDEADPQAAVTDHLWGSKRPVTNFFKKAKQVFSNIKATRPLRTFVVGSTAIHLNFDPSLRRIPVDVFAEIFSLPDLRGALADYVQWEGHNRTSQSFHKLEEQRRAAPNASLPFNDLMVWFKVWVQQASYYNQSATPPALTINASPLSTTKKYGHYDAAIFAVDDTEVEQWPVSGLKGHTVVEVRLIMQPLPPRGKTIPWAGRLLTYVQCLDVVTQRRGSVLERTMQMHVLKCAMRSAGVPFGDILPLDQLRSFAHIVPWFGHIADVHLTAQNSAHSACVFFLNKYIDKEFYYAISNSY